ncbi:hypothetical protein EAG_01473 [Camponotus floridanus]|uniref:Uncharacterized protein n=1 Tax=Camponotus floridanus TaxID=104421 RepID=E2A8S7_CAMFO|nr:hypothetical protein EAG_01473 [Camponotus floridanus]
MKRRWVTKENQASKAYKSTDKIMTTIKKKGEDEGIEGGRKEGRESAFFFGSSIVDSKRRVSPWSKTKLRSHQFGYDLSGILRICVIGHSQMVASRDCVCTESQDLYIIRFLTRPREIANTGRLVTPTHIYSVSIYAGITCSRSIKTFIYYLYLEEGKISLRKIDTSKNSGWAGCSRKENPVVERILPLYAIPKEYFLIVFLSCLLEPSLALKRATTSQGESLKFLAIAQYLKSIEIDFWESCCWLKSKISELTREEAIRFINADSLAKSS